MQCIALLGDFKRASDIIKCCKKSGKVITVKFRIGMLNRMKIEPAFTQKGLIINKVYAAGILPQFFSIGSLLHGVLDYPVINCINWYG